MITFIFDFKRVFETVTSMKKLILLIGFVTYSSLGWSKPLMMECFIEVPPLLKEMYGGLVEEKQSFGIFKMETDENPNSPNLLTKREDGQWKGNCHKTNTVCTKGDQSVVVVKTVDGEDLKFVFDFRFLTTQIKGVVVDSDTKEKEEVDKEVKCERIE